MDATRLITDSNPVLPRKINVKGASGVGKSTFAAELAYRLALTHVELDALHHGPNWTEPTIEEFRARMRRLCGWAWLTQALQHLSPRPAQNASGP